MVSANVLLSNHESVDGSIGDTLDESELQLVQELLMHPPDIWITPAVVGYRIDGR